MNTVSVLWKQIAPLKKNPKIVSVVFITACSLLIFIHQHDSAASITAVRLGQQDIFKRPQPKPNIDATIQKPFGETTDPNNEDTNEGKRFNILFWNRYNITMRSL